jgi:hypothetical protein
MDGYSNFKVTPLGHLKALLYSSVDGEVQEVVGLRGGGASGLTAFSLG